MMIDYRRFRDEDYALVGIAILVQCQLTGEISWLWSCSSTPTNREPLITQFLTVSVADDNARELEETVARLQRAGVVSFSQYMELLHAISQERQQVIDYWRQQGLPIPTISKLFSGE